MPICTTRDSVRRVKKPETTIDNKIAVMLKMVELSGIELLTFSLPTRSLFKVRLSKLLQNYSKKLLKVLKTSAAYLRHHTFFNSCLHLGSDCKYC